MKCIKKLVALTLAAVLALAMLTACGGTPSVPEATEATKQVVDNINAVRTKNGLPALEVNTAATDVANKIAVLYGKKELNLISEENFPKEWTKLSVVQVYGRSCDGYVVITANSSGEKILTKENWQITYDTNDMGSSYSRIVCNADAKYVGVAIKQISNGKYITVVATY